MRIFQTLLAAGLLNGCATTSTTMSNRSGHFTVSCAENEFIASRSHSMVVCELRSTVGEALELQVRTVALPEGSGGRLAKPQDIARYAAQSKDRGVQAAVTGLMIVAAAALGTHTTGNGGNAGGATISGGMGGVAVMATLPGSQRGSDGELPKGEIGYGPEHLLGGPMTLASGAAATRSALVLLGDLGEMPSTIEICFAGSTEECMSAPIQAWSGRARQRQST